MVVAIKKENADASTFTLDKVLFDFENLFEKYGLNFTKVTDERQGKHRFMHISVSIKVE